MSKRLAFGLGLLALLCGLAAVSKLVAPHEQGYSKSINAVTIDGKTILIVAPEPPGANFFLGSDFWGRDLFSEMLHGLGWTLGIVFATSLARCLLGLGIGLAFGVRGRNFPGRRGFSPLSAMPSFIIAAFVLYPMTINSPLPSPALFLFQSSVLVLVEFLPLASSFAAKTASLFQMPFVEAAKMGGASTSRILTRHILPFLVIDFIEALPIQAIAVAAMIGKLGIVKIFIGGSNKSYDPSIVSSARSEWLGLLGNYYDTMFTQPWLFLAPFVGWLIILSSMGLISSGLRVSFARARRIESLEH